MTCDEQISNQDKLSKNILQYRAVEKKKLILSFSITITIMTLELIGGIIINSIALVSDAGHMFTHAFAIMIGLIAIFIARKPPCHHKTYGLYRSEVLAAFINGLFLLFVVFTIVLESIVRIMNPESINGFIMLIIAVIGLSANLSSIAILQGSEKKDLNVRGVFYHMFADAAASIGIVFIAIIIIFNPEWTILDPLISIAISIIILLWAIGILKDSARILLEMAPKGINVHIIGDDLRSRFEQIKDLYNLHLWTITPGMLVFSAHIKVPKEYSDILKQEDLIEKINIFLYDNYNIVETTLQFTLRDEPQVCYFEQI